MFDAEWYYNQSGNPGKRDPKLSLRVNPSRMDHRMFVEANKEAFLSGIN